MKKYLLFFAVALSAVSANAQWTVLGPSDFNQPSYDYTINPTSAFDASGNLYVASVNYGASGNPTPTATLVVTKYNGSSWSSLGPTSGYGNVSVTSTTGIAINPTNGVPYVVYQDATTFKATVVMYSAGSWSVVGNATFSTGAVNYLSIAFTSSGTPYVAFQDGTKAEVWTLSGSTWVIAGAAVSTTTATFISLAINPSNSEPYISFKDGGSSPANKISVYSYNGSTWSLVGARGFSSAALPANGYTSIAFNSSGTPYVAYQFTSNKIVIESFNGSSWGLLTAAAGLTTIGSAATYVNLAVNSQPYVVYKQVNGKALVMQYSGSGTTWTAVGATVSAGGASYATIHFNSSGTPYLTYMDAVNGNKVTALTYNGSNWANVGVGDGITGVQTGGYGTVPLAMAMDNTGTMPYIAYSTGLGGTITVLQWNGTSWAIVGSPGFVTGYEVSIAVNPTTGQPYVGYSDYNNNSGPSVMMFDGSNWNQVGSANFEGAVNNGISYTCLAFDPNGLLYMAYVDNVTGNLNASVAEYTGTGNSGWQPVGGQYGISPGQVQYMSLAINPLATYQYVPFIAFADLTQGYKLTAMAFVGSGWITIGTGIAGGSSGIEYPSASFDANGNFYVAYMDGGNNYRASVSEYLIGPLSWQTVGSAGFSTGQAFFPSLAINSSGTPYVLYEDLANNGEATLMQYTGSGATGWSAVGSAGFTAGVVGNTSLAINSSGTPYAAFNSGGVYGSVVSETATGNAPQGGLYGYEYIASITPQGSLSANGPFCASGAGQLTWTASAGTGNYTVVYNDGVSNRTATGVVSGTPFNVFTTPVTSTTTYSLVSVTGSDAGVRSSGFTTGSATITINAIPAITGTTPGSNCGTGTVTLGATANNGGTVNWYTVSSGGSSVATGTSYTTPSISSTTTYYVDATANGCTTASRTSVTATINIPPTPTFTSSPGASTCANTAVTYTTQAAENNYLWVVPGVLNTDYTIGGGGIGTGSNTVTLNWLTTGSKTVTVNYHDVNGCTGASAVSSTTTVSNCNTVWVGGNNGNDWSTPTNWNPNGIPNGCGYNVTIPINGNDPVVNSPVSVGNLIITGNGRELITLNSSLSVCGNWTDNSGAASSVSGAQAILSGSSAQTLSGNLTFDQLSIANTNGGVSLAVGTTVGINTALLLQTGNLNTNNGTVTLNSTSVTQAAIIDNFSVAASPGNGNITGNITAQRFYGPASASNDFKQHMLGSPVSGINLSALGSNSGSSAYYIAATGGVHNCNELLGQSGTPYGNVFSYDETHANLCTMDGWKVGASNTAVSAGTGYSVVLGSGSSTLALTGPPNLNLSYSVSTTNSDYANTTSDQGRVYPSGINMVSNPYSATLNVSSLNTANSTNFSSQTVYVWNVATGSYDMNPVTIAPFQAFKVIQSATGGSSYTIPGASRTTTAGTFQRTANPIELNMAVTNNVTGLTDNTIVGFNANSTMQFDAAYDVIKLPGALTRHTMYTLNSNYWLAINVLKSISETSTVAVGFEPGVSGTYTANFSGLNSFDPTSYITLEDKQTGIMHDVRSGDYTFTSDATNDNWNRFVLHFTPPAIINTTDATCSEQGMINVIQPGAAMWNYTLADNNNVTLSSGTLNVNSPVTSSVTAGVYTLTLVDNNGYTVLKTVQVNGVQPVVASFTASANAVNVNQDVILSSTAMGATLNTWNFGDGTTDNGATVSHAYANEGVYNVILNSTSVSGCNSSASNTIAVTRSVTGVTNLNDISNILIWSNENMVNVDFTQLRDVQANIEIYNILGQKLSEDKYVTSAVYHKEIPNIEEGYIVVSVKNNDAIITKKLFISNVK